MTHKLAELLGIDESEDVAEKTENISEKLELPNTYETLTSIEKINAALSTVLDLDKSDSELDDLAEMAVSSFKDLQDLGMQTESRFSAEIFGVASNLLGHAISARTVKMNKKLKMLELQLKAATLEIKLNEKSEKIEAVPLGESKSFDRNDLLKMFSSKSLTEDK